MSKHIYVIGLFLGVMLFLSGCGNSNNSAKEPPKVTIKAGSNIISSTVSSKDKPETFQSIIKSSEIPYVKLGEAIEIELENKVSDTCEIKDYILTEEGAPKYNTNVNPTNIKFNKGIGSFVLNENPAVNLSSNSKDYESGKTIRGFQLTCTLDNKKYEYLFIIKTDAKK